MFELIPPATPTVAEPQEGAAVPMAGLRAELLQRAAQTQLRSTSSGAGRIPETGAERRQAMKKITTRSLQALWEASASPAAHAPGVALAMVGSWGRGDAGPMSDLDLVLIYDGARDPSSEVSSLAEQLWYPIWDAGLDLDHSVRSVTQIRQVAGADIPAAVGLLDLTLVAGDGDLLKQVATTLRSDWRASARKRLPDFLNSIRSRAKIHGELAYLIEPNLKEARGGIRDALMLEALAATWLTDRPHGSVDDAREWLLEVRDTAQVVTKRHTNQLLLADLDEIADVAGFPDSDDFLASVANAGREISYALDTTVRRVTQQLPGSSRRARPFLMRGRPSPPRLRSVAPGLVELSGELVLAAESRPQDDPLLALRAASAAARTGLALSPVSAASLAKCPPLAHPWPAEARECFMAFISSGTAQIPVWEALDLAGVVTQWIPQWAGVRNRPQRSAAHRHTVDRHLIEVVSHTRNLPELRHSEVIHLAALFHDIGKRKGAQDHSKVGADLIPEILGNMGFCDEIIHDVQLLVREHLTLSRFALSEDPEDDAEVEQLLNMVEHRRDLLIALQALTEADSASLGKHGWTPWRARLVATWLERGLAALAAPRNT